MVMKMAAVSAISLLLLCCFTLSSADSKAKCDHHVATGDNFTVPLEHGLDNSNRLTWKHGDLTIIDRRPNNLFTRGKREDLDEKGSLKLTNLKKVNEGTYTPELFDKDGQKIPDLNFTTLCVFDRVPKPEVKITCPKTSVKFTCMVQSQDKDLSYEWLQNNNKVSDKKAVSGNTLTLVAEAVQKDSFICNVSNRVSFMISPAVQQSCFKPKSFLPEKFLGINTWIFVGAGGGIVLVLIIVVIICCIRTKRRKRMQQKEEGELRLAWTNEQQHHQRSHPPEHHHHNHQHRQHQQQPAGHTGPRQHRSKQHRDQQRPRAPDPHGCPPPHGGQPQPSPRRPAQAPRPVDKTDDEQPPPLPQPRKKAPKTPRA